MHHLTASLLLCGLPLFTFLMVSFDAWFSFSDVFVCSSTLDVRVKQSQSWSPRSPLILFSQELYGFNTFVWSLVYFEIFFYICSLRSRSNFILLGMSICRLCTHRKLSPHLTVRCLSKATRPERWRPVFELSTLLDPL